MAVAVVAQFPGGEGYIPFQDHGSHLEGSVRMVSAGRTEQHEPATGGPSKGLGAAELKRSPFFGELAANPMVAVN
jgi:hypothetical protein